MVIDRAAATGLSRCDERICVTATAGGERPGQGRRDLGATPPDHGAGAATGYDPAAVLPRRPGVPGRPAAPAPTRRARPVPAAGAAGHGAALAARSPSPPSRGQIPPQAPGADRAPSAPSASWYCALHERTRPGATGASTANSSSSASRPPPPPCGRSFTTPGSTRRPSVPQPPGLTSSAPRPTPCWPATSSRPSPWALPSVRLGGHRARHPADPDPGYNPSSDCLLGRPSREEPRHGS